MSRGVKDLRDLIVVSRLTCRDSDEEIDSADEDFVRDLDALSLSSTGSGSRQSSANSIDRQKRGHKTPDSGIVGNGSPDFTSTQEHYPKPPSTNSSSSARKRKKGKHKSMETLPSRHELPKPSPLPPVGSRPSSSSSEGGGHISPEMKPTRSSSGYGDDSKPGNFDRMLSFMNDDVVSNWLLRANKTVSAMAQWCHAKENFVHFAHFWITDFPDIQRQEILKLEHGILLDELSMAFAAGKDQGKIRHKDVCTFLSAIFREYPNKLFSSKGSHQFLDALDVLTSERQDQYKELLSDVKVSTRNRQFAQWVLATRSFALVSVWAAVVNFYLNLWGKDTPSSALPTLASIAATQDIHEQRMFHAIRNGYIDVINWLVRSGKVDPRMKDGHGRTLIFTAVVHNQPKVIQFLLNQVKNKPDLNASSDTGNTPLHAAANNGNVLLVTTLLKAPGIVVDPRNPQTDNATPLHLAVMHGHSNVVEVLLCAKADRHAQMGDLSPLQIAKDFGHSDIVDILEDNI